MWGKGDSVLVMVFLYSQSGIDVDFSAAAAGGGGGALVTFHAAASSLCGGFILDLEKDLPASFHDWGNVWMCYTSTSALKALLFIKEAK